MFGNTGTQCSTVHKDHLAQIEVISSYLATDYKMQGNRTYSVHKTAGHMPTAMNNIKYTLDSTVTHTVSARCLPIIFSHQEKLSSLWLLTFGP